MIDKTLAFVLAGGEGKRLSPLTKERAKPAVPFAGKYRITDFPLTSLFRSPVQNIVVLPQYESRSLESHIQEAWIPKQGIDRKIKTAHPRTGGNKGFYSGTANAIINNIDEIINYNPSLVLVAAADHVTNFNVSSFIKDHLKKDQARDLTIAVQIKKVSEEDFEKGKDGKECYKYGVIRVDKNYQVQEFIEKPLKTKLNIGDNVIISMGNYIFKKDSLLEAFEQDYGNDFGNHVIVGMKKAGKRIYAYPFLGYWKDVGDIESYFNTSLELMIDNPPMDLRNLWKEEKPIITAGSLAPPTFIKYNGKKSIVCEGSDLEEGYTLENSIISPGVTIGRDTALINSIIFEGVNIGNNSMIKDTIIDKYNIIPPGTKIGYNEKDDREKGYSVIHAKDRKITVVPRAIPKESLIY